MKSKLLVLLLFSQVCLILWMFYSAIDHGVTSNYTEVSFNEAREQLEVAQLVVSAQLSQMSQTEFVDSMKKTFKDDVFEKGHCLYVRGVIFSFEAGRIPGCSFFDLNPAVRGACERGETDDYAIQNSIPK